MKDILEIRIHGRGGQGAKTASQFIAEAALREGKYVQAFPEYGPERSGAPMKSYARISKHKISIYSPVVNPDIVVVIDPTLIDNEDTLEDVLSGLKSKDILIVNTKEKPEELKKRSGFKGKVYTVDATKISIETTGKNIPNTPMLGALSKITGIISLESIKECTRNKFIKKIGEKKTNAIIEGIEKAYNSVKNETKKSI